MNLWERFEKYKTTDYIDELNQATYFFNFTIKAHLDDVLSTLSRIIEKHNDSLTIWKFLDFVEQNKDIFSHQAYQKRLSKDPAYISDKAYRDYNHHEISFWTLVKTAGNLKIYNKQ